jgi:hypothetical protein
MRNTPKTFGPIIFGGFWGQTPLGPFGPINLGLKSQLIGRPFDWAAIPWKIGLEWVNLGFWGFLGVLGLQS